MNTMHAKTMLVRSLALSLALSGCLFAGNAQAEASVPADKEITKEAAHPPHEPGVKGPHRKKHTGGLLRYIGADKLSSILGISKEQLKSELQAGKSLADIAKDRGMKKDELVGKIKEELTPAVEKAVERRFPPPTKNQ